MDLLKKSALLFLLIVISPELFPQELSFVSIVKTNETCNYLNDGTVTITITGGVKPYKYYLIGSSIFESPSTNDTFYTFTGLPARLYSINVADEDTFINNSVSITQPPALVITSQTVSPVDCNGNN